MSLDEMRNALAEMLIKSNYDALLLAKDIGIRPDVLKRFILGISSPQLHTIRSITQFFEKRNSRLWKKDRMFRGKIRMERI